MADDSYPLLKAALEDGRVESSPPPVREMRCGPWDAQPDGSIVCRKCGEVEVPGGSGPMGF